jgi:hypothetical protein
VNEAGVALVVASSVAAGLGDVSVAALVFGRRSAAEAVLAPRDHPSYRHRYSEGILF